MSTIETYCSLILSHSWENSNPNWYTKRNSPIVPWESLLFQRSIVLIFSHTHENINPNLCTKRKSSFVYERVYCSLFLLFLTALLFHGNSYCSKILLSFTALLFCERVYCSLVLLFLTGLLFSGNSYCSQSLIVPQKRELWTIFLLSLFHIRLYNIPTRVVYKKLLL